MDKINIKVHPPWYARGTPLINTRDGPAMALSDKPLLANPITIGCRGPSARGKPGVKTRRWLTLKTTFFNTQNSVSSQWYAVLGSDLSACAAPDNVNLKEDNVKLEMNDNVKMKMEDNVKMEKVDADSSMVDADRSIDAVRSEERTTVDFDLSACVAFRFIGTSSDNVKMMMEDNI